MHYPILNKITPETFCINPWYWFRINSTGKISYCLRSTDFWEDSSGDFSKDFSHNQFILSARSSILEGSFPQGCNRCAAESPSNSNFRKAQNYLAAIHHNWFNESVIQSPVYARLNKTEIQPHAIFVMFSNQCNLACRMCSKFGSNKLSEIYAMHNYTVDLDYKDDVSQFNTFEFVDDTVLHSWSDDPDRWQKFLEFVVNNHDLQLLQINGGEPFVQPQFTMLVDYLLAHNRQDLKLVITTNGTFFDQALLEKLQKFESCFVDVSLETLTETNNYIRTGSDFRTILHNLEHFFKFANDRLAFGIHLTPQAYSVETLDTLIDFCILHNLTTTANQVHPQRHLQIAVLPLSVKQQLCKQLTEKYSNLAADTNSSITQAIKNIIKWLSDDEPDDVEHLRRLFVKHTCAHDAMLNTNFSEVYPHLINYFKEYGYDCN